MGECRGTRTGEEAVKPWGINTMKQTKNLKELFEQLYDGEPWIDSNFMNTIGLLNAKQAGKRVSPKWNTIWEITNHIIDWRNHVIGRLEGKDIKVGDDNYFKPIKNKSEKAWQETLLRFAESQEKWVKFLSIAKDKDLDITHPNVSRSNSELFYAILLHDTYHLGQLVMLSKAVQ